MLLQLAFGFQLYNEINSVNFSLYLFQEEGLKYIEEHNITGIHNGAVTTRIWLGAIERCEIEK